MKIVKELEMTHEDIRKEYENAPDIIKVFNTLIDVVISNYYQSKDIYTISSTKYN